MVPSVKGTDNVPWLLLNVKGWLKEVTHHLAATTDFSGWRLSGVVELVGLEPTTKVLWNMV